MLSKRIFALVLIFILLLCYASPSVNAVEYLVSFQSNGISVSPVTNTNVDNYIKLEGTTKLTKVWFAIRGPNGELAHQSADVQNGIFNTGIWFRFGPGLYTIWAGDNPYNFDGKIRFQIQAQADKDKEYLFPSGFVNSDNEEIIKLAAYIIKDKTDDIKKIQLIHDWIVNNIHYDYCTYINGQDKFLKASEVLQNKLGTCRDYSFLFAALTRTVGIETRVIYGLADLGKGIKQLHAWNQVKINGEWLDVDVTWASGCDIKNTSLLTKTHTITMITTY